MAYKTILGFITLCAINAIIAIKLAPYKLLNDGNKMPSISIGTYNLYDLPKFRQAMTWAISAGFRQIDTAAYYKSEPEVGKGIQDAIEKGIVTRKDLFITTKLWNANHATNQVLPALKESLRKLRLDYVDLYVMHFPYSLTSDGVDSKIDYLETWKAMEQLKEVGLTKSIGISNFNQSQIERLLKLSETKPATIELEVNPTFTNQQLTNYCKKVGIQVMGYSPFGFLVPRHTDLGEQGGHFGPYIDDPTLLKIARKYNKSVYQVVLRYSLDRGLVTIVKSVNKTHIEEDIKVFDFHLTKEEIKLIDAFNENVRVISNKPHAKNIYYPFRDYKFP